MLSFRTFFVVLVGRGLTLALFEAKISISKASGYRFLMLSSQFPSGEVILCVVSSDRNLVAYLPSPEVSLQYTLLTPVFILAIEANKNRWMQLNETEVIPRLRLNSSGHKETHYDDL